MSIRGVAGCIDYPPARFICGMGSLRSALGKQEVIALSSKNLWDSLRQPPRLQIGRDKKPARQRHALARHGRVDSQSSLAHRTISRPRVAACAGESSRISGCETGDSRRLAIAD